LPVLKIISIQRNHLSSNLICAIILVAEWSIVSKTLAKSSFSNMISFLDVSHWCRNSKAWAIQSWMFLYLRKPYLFLCTILRTNACSLFASSLVRIFRTKLRSVIGQKSLTRVGDGTLGMSVTYPILILSRFKFPS
jgi:hypothetical protein